MFVCYPIMKKGNKRQTQVRGKENWFEHISDCVVKHKNNDTKYLMIGVLKMYFK